MSILVYQGADGDLIKAAVDSGAKGIVIAGAGAGATSGTQGEGIDYAIEKGRVRRDDNATGRGRIAARGGRGRGGAGTPPPERDAAPDRRRGSRAGQGARAADARADAHERSRGNPADVHRILNARPGGPARRHRGGGRSPDAYNVSARVRPAVHAVELASARHPVQCDRVDRGPSLTHAAGPFPIELSRVVEYRSNERKKAR